LIITNTIIDIARVHTYRAVSIFLLSVFFSFFFFFLFIITLIRREMELRNAECIRLSGREGEIRSTAVGLSVTLVGAMCGSRVEFNNVNLASERWAFVWD